MSQAIFRVEPAASTDEEVVKRNAQEKRKGQALFLPIEQAILKAKTATSLTAARAMALLMHPDERVRLELVKNAVVNGYRWAPSEGFWEAAVWLAINEAREAGVVWTLFLDAVGQFRGGGWEKIQTTDGLSGFGGRWAGSSTKKLGQTSKEHLDFVALVKKVGIEPVTPSEEEYAAEIATKIAEAPLSERVKAFEFKSAWILER